MLCRVLLTIVAVSYLICVLLLNGLQKADLDVTMLNKLQRHNVNIDDLNEENRKECLSSAPTVTPARSTDIITTEATKEEGTQNLNLNNPTYEQLETIMEHFNDFKRTDKQNGASILENSTKDFVNTEKYTTLQISNVKSDFIIDVKNDQLNTKKTQTETKPIDGVNNSDLQKFIKVWNMYNKVYRKDNIKTDSNDRDSGNKDIINTDGIDRVGIHTEDINRDGINRDGINRDGIYKDGMNGDGSYRGDVNRDSINIDSINIDSINTKDITTTFTQVEQYTPEPHIFQSNNNENRTEMESIRNIIMEYMLKNKIATTASPTSTKNIDINAISRQIQQYFAVNNGSSKQIKTDVVKEQNISQQLSNNFLNSMYKEAQLRNMGNNDVQNFNPNTEIDKNKANQYVNQAFQTNDEIYGIKPVTNYMSSVPQEPYSFQQNEFNVKAVMPYQAANNVKVSEKNIFSNEENFANGNNKKDVKIPVNLVKEIAEGVKAIIFKDLQKDISTITPKYIYTSEPYTTTAKITTETKLTTAKQDKLPDAKAFMEKFMDLIQQFKSVTEKAVITDSARFKTTEKKTTQHKYNGPLKIEYPPLMPPINPYGLMRPAAQLTRKFPNPYDLYTNVNAPIRHNTNNNMKNVHRTNQATILHPKNEQKAAPLTIQTNLYEIPPLNIAVSKPEQAIRQNIVVTTRNPFERPKIDRRHADIIPQNYKYDKNRNEWLNKYSLSNQAPKYDKNIVRDKYKDSRFIIDIRDRPKYSNRYDDNSQYRSGYYKSDYDRRQLRNQEINKFHERLEKPADSNISADPEECCNVKIPSRQQLPLHKIGKPRYDDTHFKNFLKTQQRVNDMLERILATKTGSDRPHIVEHA